MRRGLDDNPPCRAPKLRAAPMAAMPALYVDMRGAVTVKYDTRAIVNVSDDPLPLHTAACNGDVALAMYHVMRGASAGQEKNQDGATAMQIAEARVEAVLPERSVLNKCGSFHAAPCTRATHYCVLHTFMGGAGAYWKLANGCRRLAPAAKAAADAARVSLDAYSKASRTVPEGRVPGFDCVPALLRRTAAQLGPAASICFCRGFVTCLMVISELLAEGNIPAPGLVIAHVRWITSAVGNLNDFTEYLVGGGTVEFALDAVFAFAGNPSSGAPVPPPANHPLEHFDCLHSVLLGPNFQSGPHPLLGTDEAEMAAWQRAAYPISHRTDYLSICKSLKIAPPTLPQPPQLQVVSQQPEPSLEPPPLQPPLPPPEPEFAEPTVRQPTQESLGDSWAASHNMRPTGQDGILIKEGFQDAVSSMARFFGWAGVKSREAETGGLQGINHTTRWREPVGSSTPPWTPAASPSAPMTRVGLAPAALRAAVAQQVVAIPSAPLNSWSSQLQTPLPPKQSPYVVGPGAVQPDHAPSDRDPGVPDSMAPTEMEMLHGNTKPPGFFGPNGFSMAPEGTDAVPTKDAAHMSPTPEAPLLAMAVTAPGPIPDMLGRYQAAKAVQPAADQDVAKPAATSATAAEDGFEYEYYEENAYAVASADGTSSGLVQGALRPGSTGVTPESTNESPTQQVREWWRPNWTEPKKEAAVLELQAAVISAEPGRLASAIRVGRRHGVGYALIKKAEAAKLAAEDGYEYYEENAYAAASAAPQETPQHSALPQRQGMPPLQSAEVSPPDVGEPAPPADGYDYYEDENEPLSAVAPAPVIAPGAAPGQEGTSSGQVQGVLRSGRTDVQAAPPVDDYDYYEEDNE